MRHEKLTLIDAEGNPLAHLEAMADGNDWFVGKVVSEQFPAPLKDALAWYDEVVEGQMLSYLDAAAEAVAQFGLRVRHPDGTSRPVFSLHIDKQNDVSFRISPVPPPAWLAKSASA